MSVLGFEPKINKLKVYCFTKLSYTLLYYTIWDVFRKTWTFTL